MGRIVDKILIFALSLFAMYSLLAGNTWLVCIYISIIYSAATYYLIDIDSPGLYRKPVGLKEWTAYILEIGLAAIALFVPTFIFIIPSIIYDSVRSRNYIASVICAMAVFGALFEYQPELLIYIIIISVVAAVLSIRSEHISISETLNRRLRDDSTEKAARLRLQNADILDARSTEIYNAQLSERNRIAREIHDNVGHTLSRAILQMGALLAIHKEEPVHSELESVRGTLDEAMTNIRTSVHDLHNDSIDVRAGIYQIAEPLKEVYNVNLDIDISDDTPRTVKYAIIGIAKEAVSNIMKHSSNTNVDIRINEHPSMYQLVIHDYSPASYSNRKEESSYQESSFEIQSKKIVSDDLDTGTRENEMGMGLENIRGRVESVDGTLSISSDNGFRIFVTIPRAPVSN